MSVCNFLLVACYFLFVVCSFSLFGWFFEDKQKMITTWNLVDEKVTNNPPEIHVCDCFLNFAIKYHQKTDITLSNFKSDLLKLVDDETELHMIIFFLSMLFGLMMLFLDWPIQVLGMKDII